MNQIDLQQLLDRELKQLPDPPAPDTLLPRVLAATVHQAPSGSYGGWLAWPRGWQAASAAALGAVLVGAWTLMQMIHPGDYFWRATGGFPSRADGLVQSASEASVLVRVLWEVLLRPVATYLSALAISFAVACALLWTALERLALGGATER